MAPLPWPSLKAGALALGAVLALACGPRRQVWFTPNLDSPDMLDLFTRGQEWPRARRHVDVFKFYSQQLLYTAEECAPCGANVLDNLTRVQAFGRLRAWGLAIAAEVPVVKPHACDGGAAAALTDRLIDNVAARGGVVRYLAMDEPLVSGAACAYDLARTARETGRFVRGVREAHPAVAIGDIEAYPHFSVDELRAWVAALDENGVRLAFFHLDVDHRRTDREGREVAPDVRAIQAFCKERSLPFGILLAGTDALDDAGYYRDVVGWTGNVAAAVGMPEHVIVQSFSRTRDGLFQVPRNLPEDDAATPTHTRLLNEALDIVKAPPRGR